MVIGIIGENCSGKTTLAEKIKETLGGRYHRLGIGTRMFQRLIEDYPVRRSPSILHPMVSPSIKRLDLRRPMKKRQ